MSKRKVKIEDLRKFIFVSDPQVSPDGRRIAFVRTRVNYDEDSYVKHVWLWDRETGKAEQFTHGTGSDSYPRWSPDSTQILFLSSKREPDKKGAQLWVIPSDGGEAQLMAELEDAGVTKPTWSPDSKSALFLARVWERGKPETDVKVVKRINFRLNGVGLFPGKRIHLFTASLGRKPRQLTKGEYDVDAAAWSPDGKEVAFVTNPDEGADLSYIRDVYRIPSKGGEWTMVTDGKHLISNLFWAPNGDEIAFLGHDLHEMSATNTDIWVIPSEGGKAKNLTAAFDRSIGRGIGSDLKVSSPNPGAVWASDSSALYFLTGSVPHSSIYRVDRDSCEIEQLTEGITVDGFSLSGDESVMGYIVMNATHLDELYVRDDEGNRRITKFNDRLLNSLDLSAPEAFTFRNELGNEIDAWVMKPPDFEAGRRYPTVLQIHGGPLGIYGDGIFLEFQLLMAAGYVVLYTNPRGSGGYGEEYGAVLQGQHGTVDYRDLMTFMDDALERFEFIDGERLGVTGGSYGGYMTNWIVTQTDRFKAAVSCRSTCNRYSHHGYSDMGFRHGPSGNMGYPWRDEDKLLTQSPIRFATNVKTPTLLIHSENDLRCPIGQAEEFFVALKELGVDTELVRFPDENHELSRSGKPKHREERLSHILRWFDAYLKPQ
ncbi:MAG TPA: S9 family peptidase [Patescibacteria group bacterium]|nr:S9 family peptidase [Patescibacteria group bacterium]